MATTAVVERGPAAQAPVWGRPVLIVSGGLVVLASVLAALRLPVQDTTVWAEALVVSASTTVLLAVIWWLTGRSSVVDQRIVLRWGLGSGVILGALWIAEIAFNNLTPHSLSTASTRGVVDNATWAVVGVATMVAAGRVTASTGRWRSGVRAAAWSGVASGLGAAAGGALLMAFLRATVERDPLMRDEWQARGSGIDLATYVTRETMAGVGGHLWVLGVVQGVLLGVIAATATAAVARSRRGARTP